VQIPNQVFQVYQSYFLKHSGILGQEL